MLTFLSTGLLFVLLISFVIIEGLGVGRAYFSLLSQRVEGDEEIHLMYI